MSDDEIRNLFATLWFEFKGDDCFPNKRPSLAHYTQADVLESILKNKEVWFSHPVLMNDSEEVVFDLNTAAQLFLSNQRMKAACGTAKRVDTLKSTFTGWFNRFAKQHFPNTFVLSFPEQARGDRDGLLSVWRAYGDGVRAGALVLHATQ